MNQPLRRAHNLSARQVMQSILTAAATLLVIACFHVPAHAQTSARSAGKKPAASIKHPAVPAGQECSDCHQQQNREWEAGPHGQNQVKCLVCHGAIEEGFMARPAVSRCESCHDRQVAQLKTDPFMKGKTCFTCHPPHALKPHLFDGEGGKS